MRLRKVLQKGFYFVFYATDKYLERITFYSNLIFTGITITLQKDATFETFRNMISNSFKIMLLFEIPTF